MSEVKRLANGEVMDSKRIGNQKVGIVSKQLVVLMSESESSDNKDCSVQSVHL